MPVNKDDPYGPAKAETAPIRAKRDYIGDALAALSSPVGTPAAQSVPLISAIIVAQALDRLGRKMVEAAAISKTRA